MLKDFTSPSNPQTDDSSDRCTHLFHDVRRRIASNGVTHFVLQCTNCGNEVKKLGKNDPIRLALTELPPLWDEDLVKRYWDSRFDRMRERTRLAQEERERKDREWWDRYNRYLRSPEWAVKRNARIRMDEGRCQARMRGCTGTAEQVHHLNYDHVGNEPLFELVSVCCSCHDQLTAMDRAQKGVAA